MSSDLYKYLRYLLPLFSIPLIWMIVQALTSTFVLVDPSASQAFLTVPFDIVLEHQGCGPVDATSLQASLTSQTGESHEISLRPDDSISSPQRWILADYDPKNQFSQGSFGNFTLTVTADAPPICLEKQADFSFKVAESLGLDSGYYSFTSVLHDGADVDEFVVKSEGGAAKDFGDTIRVTVITRKPEGFEVAFRYLGPQGGNMIERKKSAASLWMALKKGVSTRFRISRESSFPNDGSLVSYEILVKYRTISEKNELNDTANTATELKKGASLTSYMVAVLDDQEKIVGLDDWYWIDHKDCVVDCFNLNKNHWDNRNFVFDFCKDPKGCDGGGMGGNCSDTAGAANEEGDGRRYVRVTADCTGGICEPFGESAPSEHYQQPYFLSWYERCKYAKFADPSNKNCDRSVCNIIK